MLRAVLLVGLCVLGACSSPGGNSSEPGSGAALRAAAAAGAAAEAARLVAAGAPRRTSRTRRAAGTACRWRPWRPTRARRRRCAAGRGCQRERAGRARDTPWLQAGALGRTDILRRMVDAKPDLTIRNRTAVTL